MTLPSSRVVSTDASDGELMGLVREGDEQAFEVLVNRHKHALVNYLTKLTRCRDRAEEYAQETFVRLFETADRYRDRGLLSAYLYRIATNLLRSEERRKSRWRVLRPKYSQGIETVGPTPQRDLESSEAVDQVTHAIAELPLRYRAPLVLREIEGLAYSEIATVIGCREGTVKSRINRAKKKLRETLEGYWLGRAKGESSEERSAVHPRATSSMRGSATHHREERLEGVEL